VPGNLHPPWQGKNLRSANLPARERTQARRCLRKPINLLSIVSGKRFWHDETSAQPSKVSVDMKEQETRATQSCTVFVFIGAQSSGPSGGDCTLPRSPVPWVEQLYSDLCPRAVLQTWARRFRMTRSNTLCSTPGFLRGAVSGAREIKRGALLPCILHETIRPDFENGNASHSFLRSRYQGL
jgi:hypothetical protein